jgi:hypothetical protein
LKIVQAAVYALMFVRLKIKKKTKLKAINMVEQLPLRETERANWDFFLKYYLILTEQKLMSLKLKILSSLSRYLSSQVHAQDAAKLLMLNL